eukprot:TRINITY_DN1032_c0_g1_i1.p1 TRINITY_DN1032_c0_g1~~TRINITY_DN1032_c0_g1_i1.p1  ORF type:complete len:647 (+),score=173.00 TRINITY_DN1032_c0_g1_i1:53-1993(+)
MVHSCPLLLASHAPSYHPRRFAMFTILLQRRRLPGWDYVGKPVNVLRTGYGDGSIRDQLKFGEERVLELSSETKNADTRPADTDWVIARNTISTFYPRCDWHAESHTVRAVFDFQRELGLAFKLEGETERTEYTDSVAGTLSPSYQSTSADSLAYTSFLFDSLCRCQDFRLELKPNQNGISSSYFNAITNLPVAFDARDTPNVNKFVAFFEQWGTHVVEGFTSGGTITQRMSMSVTSYLDFQAQGMNVEAAVEAEFSRNVNVTVPLPDSHAEFTEATFEAEVHVTGGNESIRNNFQAWRPTVLSDPAPLQLQAYPHHHYLTREAFGGAVSILDRQVGLNNALQYYLQIQANLPDLLPTMGICRRWSSKFENECEALCPADSVVLGGACKVEEYAPDDTQLPWRLTVSKKSDNGWMCRSSDDYGSGAKGYHRKVYSLALCAKKNIRSDMAPPANQGIQVHTTQVPCEGPMGEEGSECTAVCPEEFLVTGGGCQPSDVALHNTSFPFQVAASAPSAAVPNAWRCAIRPDKGGDVKQSQAIGFATCTNWTSSFQFRPAHYSLYPPQLSTGTGETTATAFAKCPAGSIVVGGGCDAALAARDSWWRLSRSWPRDNGWRCDAAQDAKSGVKGQTVRAAALCIRFNVDDATP